MHLYVLPGACSLASHVALESVAEVAGKSFKSSVTVLERGRNHEPPFTSINPLGSVPALVTSDGRVILESLAVLLHIADAHPDVHLAPSVGEHARDRIHYLLSLMVTTGHTAFQMLWRSERFADTADAQEALQRMCEQRLGKLFARLECEIGDSGLLAGDRLTVADFYLFVLCRWGLRLQHPTTAYPKLWKFAQHASDYPAVQRAMVREGIALHGPAAGLG